jgi:mannosylglycerate hydrolase
MLDRALELLESGSLACFTLDGQSIVLEDYLQRRPEHTKRVINLVQKGHLKIGPWYVLADEFLVSGEALLRNLTEGRKVARSLGGVSEVAYSPDPFGHVSQMPQIVRGFGMETFVFARGLDQTPTATVYQWEGPDGSRAQALFLATSYSNGRLLGASKDLADRLRAEVERLRPYLSAPVVLLCAGSDHEVPRDDIGQRVSAVAQDLSPWRLHIGTLETYRDLLKSKTLSTPLLRGELRGARLLPLLPGVLSARIPLKQANDRCQDLLEGKTEPISALACMLGAGNPATSLRAAWRELLQNQAHDSICGCSIDAVHRENAARFERVQQVANAVLDDATAFLARQAVGPEENAHLRVCFNALEQPVEAVVPAVLLEPLQPTGTRTARGDRATMSTWVAKGSDGKARRTQVLDEDVQEGCFPFPSATPLRRTRLLLGTTLPGLGYETVRLSRQSPGEGHPQRPSVSCGEEPQSLWMQNDHCRVEVARDGRLTLIHRRSDARWEGQALFESQADAGDSYNFSPLGGAQTLLGLTSSSTSVLHRGPLRSTILVRGTLRVPAALTRERRRRSRRLVSIPVRLAVSLTSDSPILEFDLKLRNRAKDHRLRIRFPLRATVEQSWAQSAFDVVRRHHIGVPSEGWIEDPATTHPQGGACFVPEDWMGSRGLLLLARGLPEYELVCAPEPYLALTLLRCVGWLSREDVASRRCQAGPKIATPEAQCLGTQRFSFALVPWVDASEPMTAARMLRFSRRFAIPPWSVDANPPIGFGQESWPVPPVLQDTRLAGTAGLVTVEGPSVILTALFCLDQNTLILRLLQADQRAGQAHVKLHESLGSSWRATMANLEATPLPGGSLSIESQGWKVPLQPWSLVTLRLERTEAP